MLCQSMFGVFSSGWYTKGVNDVQQSLRRRIFDEDNRAKGTSLQAKELCGPGFWSGGKLTDVTISTIGFYSNNFV